MIIYNKRKLILGSHLIIFKFYIKINKNWFYFEILIIYKKKQFIIINKYIIIYNI